MRNSGGLLVVGATPQCGKSAVTAGIGLALEQLGMRVDVVKPVDFHNHRHYQPGPLSDGEFLARCLPPSQSVQSVWLPSAMEMTGLHWNRLLKVCTDMPNPVIIDTVGTVATPIRFDAADHISTVLDLAKAVGFPILLVVRKSPWVIEQMVPVLTLLAKTRTPVMGWVAVETAPAGPLPFWENDCHYLMGAHRIPCLGELPHHPSIQVGQGYTGALHDMTELGVDLLPIQQALSLSVV